MTAAEVAEYQARLDDDCPIVAACGANWVWDSDDHELINVELPEAWF